MGSGPLRLERLDRGVTHRLQETKPQTVGHPRIKDCHPPKAAPPAKVCGFPMYDEE
jgi:hypothetical protein